MCPKGYLDVGSELILFWLTFSCGMLSGFSVVSFGLLAIRRTKGYKAQLCPERIRVVSSSSKYSFSLSFVRLVVVQAATCLIVSLNLT